MEVARRPGNTELPFRDGRERWQYGRAMDGDENRTQALRDLIEFLAPVDRCIMRLRAFPWDSATELVVLDRADARRVLDGFISQRIDGAHACEWANAIESRDDVGFEPGHDVVLRELIFTLANPDITEPLSVEMAERWRTKLR